MLSQMFKDKESAFRDPSSLPTGLWNLNRDSVSFKAVGPLADNCYGVWVSFTVLNNADIKFNQQDWIQNNGE